MTTEKRAPRSRTSEMVQTVGSGLLNLSVLHRAQRVRKTGFVAPAPKLALFQTGSETGSETPPDEPLIVTDAELFELARLQEIAASFSVLVCERRDDIATRLYAGARVESEEWEFDLTNGLARRKSAECPVGGGVGE